MDEALRYTEIRCAPVDGRSEDVQVRFGATDLEVVMACPRCRHRVEHIQPDPRRGRSRWWRVATAAMRGRRHDAARIVVSCNCVYPHLGRPPGARGCGASWALILPDGPAPSPSDRRRRVARGLVGVAVLVIALVLAVVFLPKLDVVKPIAEHDDAAGARIIVGGIAAGILAVLTALLVALGFALTRRGDERRSRAADAARPRGDTATEFAPEPRAVPAHGLALAGIDLSDARLAYAQLRDADLTMSDLGNADLRRANLRGTSLAGASLVRAELAGADLAAADLRRADLSGADLRNAVLDRAILTGATFDADTRWPQGFEPASRGATQATSRRDVREPRTRPGRRQRRTRP